MHDVLSGLRKIIHRWVNAESPIVDPISAGDQLLTLRTSHRFKPGDDVLITDGVEFEYPHIVAEVPDSTHVVLAEGVRFSDWDVDLATCARPLRGSSFRASTLAIPIL